MSKHIKMDGKKYVVMENMGYVHDRQAYGKWIRYGEVDRVVLKINGKWELATAEVREKSNYIGQ